MMIGNVYPNELIEKAAEKLNSEEKVDIIFDFEKDE